MRIFALFLCLFLLIISCGTLTYIYILWNTYWIRVAKLTEERNHIRQQHNAVRVLEGDDQPIAIGRFVPLAVAAAAAAARAEKHEKQEKLVDADFERPDEPGLSDIPSDKLLAHVRHYEKQIISQLRGAVVETGKSVLSGEVQNIYKVKVDPKKRGSKLKSEKSPKELVCSAAKNIDVRTFLKGDEFFRRQQLDQYLPEKPLNLFRENFKTCGVVSSAGSLLGSNLGDHINKNDYVIRFNNAPTHGFEKHVGTKTSLRIVNSQVVGKPEFRFLDESASLRTRKLFSKSPVLVWDPSGYNSSLEEWYNHPDFPFFQTFFSKRLMRPDEEAHLLHPSSLWSIWDWLQAESKWPLLPNPPSSGFLGLILALLRCQTVHVYEYVPSMRLTKRCHYYEEEENLGCTIGEWHPLATEKLMAIALNVGNVTQVYSDGYLVIPGMKGLNCSSAANVENSKSSGIQ